MWFAPCKLPVAFMGEVPGAAAGGAQVRAAACPLHSWGKHQVLLLGEQVRALCDIQGCRCLPCAFLGPSRLATRQVAPRSGTRHAQALAAGQAPMLSPSPAGLSNCRAGSSAVAPDVELRGRQGGALWHLPTLQGTGGGF